MHFFWSQIAPLPRRSARLANASDSTATAYIDGNDIRSGDEDATGAAVASSNDDLRIANQYGPLSKKSLYQRHEQEIRELKSKIIRPLRPTRIGHVQTRDAGDDCFIRSAIDREIFSQYVANPKCEDTASCD